MDFDKSINTPMPPEPEGKKEVENPHDPDPWPESLNNQSHFENPWAVDDGLEHFLLYCCPECDMKHVSRELFLQHAINQHPLIKECLHMLTGVKDESFLDDDYIDEDNIMDTADPIKVPIIYFFNGRSPSRRKKIFFHLASALMEHFLEWIATLVHKLK